MEKCSMCIQMTQKTILDAKLEGRSIKDGEFQNGLFEKLVVVAPLFLEISMTITVKSLL